MDKGPAGEPVVVELIEFFEDALSHGVRLPYVADVGSWHSIFSIEKSDPIDVFEELMLFYLVCTART